MRKIFLLMISLCMFSSVCLASMADKVNAISSYTGETKKVSVLLDAPLGYVSNDEIREKKFNLNISLYAYQSVLQDALTVSNEDAINVWISSHSQCINEMDELIKLIK